MSISRAFDCMQSTIAKSNIGIWAAIKLRNQAEAVIGKRMSCGIRADSNGETRLLDIVAPEARVVVDVGANVGSWFDLLRARAPGLERAILFEPGQEAAARLGDKYANDSQVVLINKAVSDHVGTAAFFELNGTSELSSLVGTPDIVAASKNVAQVNVTTIDQLQQELGLKYIDILKIDAEGVDMKVLRGSERCLSEQLIRLVQFEYNKSWAYCGETLGGALKFLNDRNYSVFLLKQDGLFDCNYEAVQEYFRYSNFVAVRSSAVASVEKFTHGSII